MYIVRRAIYHINFLELRSKGTLTQWRLISSNSKAFNVISPVVARTTKFSDLRPTTPLKIPIDLTTQHSTPSGYRI